MVEHREQQQLHALDLGVGEPNAGDRDEAEELELRRHLKLGELRVHEQVLCAGVTEEQRHRTAELRLQAALRTVAEHSNQLAAQAHHRLHGKATAAAATKLSAQHGRAKQPRVAAR